MELIQGGGGGDSKGGGGGHVATEANDTLRSIQYARVLDAVCEGEIEGLVNGMQSVFFDDVPLQNPNGTYNFLRAAIATRIGTQSQTPITGFDKGVEAEVPVGILVSILNGPVVRTINSSSVNRVRVTLSTPRLSYQDPTNGDTSGSTFQYKISIQNSGGGYVDQYLSMTSASATILNNIATTVANSSGVSGKILLYNSGTQPVSATIRVDYSIHGVGSWNTLTTKVMDVYPVDYNNMGFLAQTAVYAVTNNLSPINKFEFSNSGLTPSSYDVRVVVVSGANITATIFNCSSLIQSVVGTLSGKTTSKYSFSHEFNLNSSAPHNIKITRLTADAPTSNYQSQIYWDSYTEIVSTTLNYPNTALVGVQIDALQFRAIPKRSYHLKLKKVSIPNNYNPITRVYTGIWDGGFITAWTDNPVWCFYDLVTNTRYGLGEYIPSSWVNKAELYTIGKYCDELVPDGLGMLEPRFTCNLYLQNQEDAFKVIQNMASIFRAMLYWLGGTITPVADKPESVWAQFTNADVIDGLFTYQGSANRARHTVALVTWNDPLDRCKQKIEYVEDSDGITRYGVNPIDIPTIGCSSRGQAHRLGRWALYSERLETDIITFKAGLKGYNILPGKIITTFDQFRAGVRNAGKIISSTTNSINIDNPIITDTADLYTLNLEMPDGTLVTRLLDSSSGSNNVLTWGTSLSTLPLDGTIWMISETALTPESWRVISITEDTDSTYTITALEHNPSKFNFIEQNIQLVTPPTSIYTDINKVNTISNPVTSDSVYKLSNSTLATKMHVSWDSVAGA